MKIDIHDRTAVERALWEEIEKHPVGMLGVTGDGAHHTQPMTGFAEPQTRRIWFFTRTNTNLAREVGSGRAAMFVVQRPDLQACISGRLREDHDGARMRKYWNAVVAAWNPGGLDDPKLTLLRLDCDDAQVWISQAGPARFAWEIAKANATRHAPEVGGHANLSFH